MHSQGLSWCSWDLKTFCLPVCSSGLRRGAIQFTEQERITKLIIFIQQASGNGCSCLTFWACLFYFTRKTLSMALRCLLFILISKWFWIPCFLFCFRTSWKIVLNAAFVYSKRNIYNKIICRKIFKKLGISVSLLENGREQLQSLTCLDGCLGCDRDWSQYCWQAWGFHLWNTGYASGQ